MIPEVVKRQIGEVVMIELKGSLAGPWVSRGSAQFQKAFSGLKGEKVIVNLRHASELDSLGARTLFDLASEIQGGGIIPGSKGIMDIFQLYPESSRFQVIEDEHQLAAQYGNQ